jgi:hypothetical protein
VNLPDVVLLKEYARYLARSRVGRISDKLSMRSILHYINMIIAVMRQACGHSAPSMAVIRSETSAFIRGDLVEQEGLHTAMYPKSVAHSRDVTFILSTLYSPNYLSTFGNMRTVLNLTLYMLLMIDLCGRGADIARHNLRPDHMCLRWEDITFYSFQCDDDDSVDIRAHIKVRWSKGKTLDQSADRTIPLPALLPVSSTLQDTLRILLNLALMDGVFGANIQTWEHLSAFRLPADVAEMGRIIPMNSVMRKVPVLRRMQDRKVSDTPVQTIDMQSEIRRLGRACGFEHRFTAYSLRRGVAYILAAQTRYVSPHVRRKTGS